MSCIQFVERISCKFIKNKNPNKITKEEEFVLYDKNGKEVEYTEAENENHSILASKLGVDCVDSADGRKKENENKCQVVGVVPSMHLHDWFDPVFI